MKEILNQLSHSKFRSRFVLKEKDKIYISEKGKDVIVRHAQEIVYKRLSFSHPLHDGRQTPMKGHPVFIAQHATATCCRKCLYRWHHIPEDVNLNEEEQQYIVHLIMAWIERQCSEEINK